ncbi:MAG: hypothetical protein IIV15_02240, partial [Ruminococcus sp.]|nr:hypothetical protein [Ruminococcus sp.]
MRSAAPCQPHQGHHHQRGTRLLMEEFLGRMKSLLGGEYDEFLKYYEAEHFRGLRVNTLKCTPEKLRSL